MRTRCGPSRQARRPTPISTRFRSTAFRRSTCRTASSPTIRSGARRSRRCTTSSRTRAAPAYHTALKAAVAQRRESQGPAFPDWALDQAGIDVMLANRIAMGPGSRAAALSLDRVRRSADAAARHARRSGAHARHEPLYPREAKLLQRYLRDLNVRALPATLDEYVRTVVDADAARKQRAAARSASSSRRRICVRSISTIPIAAAAARDLRASTRRGGAPSRAEYKNARGLSLSRDRARSRAAEARRADPRARDVRRLLLAARQRAASARAGVQRFDAARHEVHHRPRRLAARRRDAGSARASRTSTPTSR